MFIKQSLLHHNLLTYVCIFLVYLLDVLVSQIITLIVRMTDEIMNCQWFRNQSRDLSCRSAGTDFWGCGFESRWGHGCLSLVRSVDSGLCNKPITHSEECYWVCDPETLTVRGPRPELGCYTKKNYGRRKWLWPNWHTVLISSWRDWGSYRNLQ